MSWRDRIKTEDTSIAESEPKRGSSWRDRIETEPEASYLSSFGAGAAQGASFGLADEGVARLKSWLSDKPYDEALKEIREWFKEKEEANPATFTTGDIGASVATGLIPGLNVVRGVKAASQAGRLGKTIAGMKTVGKNVGAGAAQGGLDAYGRSEGNEAQDAMQGAMFGGGTVGALTGAGRLAGKFIPGHDRSFDFMNKAYGKAAKFAGLKEGRDKTYQDMLSNPDRYKRARDARDNLEENIMPFRREAEKFVTGVNKKVSDKYDNLQADAFTKNFDDADFMRFRDFAAGNLDSLQKEIDDSPDFFRSDTKSYLKRAQMALLAEDPEAKRFLENYRAIMSLGEAVPRADMEKLNTQYRRLMGKRITEAKRQLSDGINWASSVPGASDDQRILKEAYNDLNEITHRDLAGASDMKQADEMFSSFKDYGQDFLKSLSKRGPSGEEISTRKLVSNMLDAGGAGARAERKAFEKGLRTIGDEYPDLGINKDIDEYNRLFTPLRDAQDVARIEGETGASTGRSLMPFAVGAAGAGLGALGGGGVSGTTFAIMSAIAFPAINPGAYLRAINAASDIVERFGESQASRIFGRGWTMVKSALAKHAYSDEARQQ